MMKQIEEEIERKWLEIDRTLSGYVDATPDNLSPESCQKVRGKLTLGQRPTTVVIDDMEDDVKISHDCWYWMDLDPNGTMAQQEAVLRQGSTQPSEPASAASSSRAFVPETESDEDAYLTDAPDEQDLW